MLMADIRHFENAYLTRKSCLETNMKAALRYRQLAISNLLSISKFSQGLCYINALAIMQHFRDNEKKN